ncbi:MAG TPA: CHAD domain-containing protein, partial [Geobacter anodireducens]|nr:CHAD domain-containing protein [Geobacter anodireducens]
GGGGGGGPAWGGRCGGGPGELIPRRTREALARIVASPALFSPPPSGIDPFTTIAAFAADRLRERLDHVLALVPDACREADVEAQHRLRIAVKHYRYRLEILSFLPGDAFAALHAAIKAYQDVLGTMHDLDVFAGIVRHEGLPSADECVILTHIAGERHRQFALFAGLLAETPFEAIGEQVRRAL